MNNSKRIQTLELEMICKEGHLAYCKQQLLSSNPYLKGDGSYDESKAEAWAVGFLNEKYDQENGNA